MKRGRAIALAVVLAVIATVAGFMALRPREPVYQGKRLSEWLHELDKDTFTKESRAQATEAVRRIGTNGIPFLEKMLRSDPWLRRKLIELSGKQSVIREVSAETLGEMGSAASASIPVLLATLNDGESSVRKAASKALIKIDPKWQHKHE